MKKPNIIEDTDYAYCSEDDCDGKIVLASEYIRTVEPDPEPYRADEEVDIPPIMVDTYFNCHACEECGKIQDSWHEDYGIQPGAVPEVIEALIAVYPLLEDYIDFTNRDEFFSEKSTAFLEGEKVDIENALIKAGVDL